MISKDWLNLVIDKDEGKRWRPGGKIKTCRTCGKQFQTNVNKRYCSDECAAKAYKPGPPLGTTQKCAVCGAEFIKNHSRRRYCKKHRRKNWNPNNVIAHLGMECECAYCGKKFDKAVSNQKYCGRQCATAAWKEQQRIKNLATRYAKKHINYRKCHRCKRVFHTKAMGRMYCAPCAKIQNRESVNRRNKRKRDARLLKILAGKCSSSE